MAEEAWTARYTEVYQSNPKEFRRLFMTSGDKKQAIKKAVDASYCIWSVFEKRFSHYSDVPDVILRLLRAYHETETPISFPLVAEGSEEGDSEDSETLPLEEYFEEAEALTMNDPYLDPDLDSSIPPPTPPTPRSPRSMTPRSPRSVTPRSPRSVTPRSPRSVTPRSTPVYLDLDPELGSSYYESTPPPSPRSPRSPRSPFEERALGDGGSSWEAFIEEVEGAVGAVEPIDDPLSRAQTGESDDEAPPSPRKRLTPQEVLDIGKPWSKKVS